MKIHSVTIETDDGSQKTMTVDEFKSFRRAFARMERISKKADEEANPERKEQVIQYDMFMQQQQLEMLKQQILAEKQRQQLQHAQWTNNTIAIGKPMSSAKDDPWEQVKVQAGGFV